MFAGSRAPRADVDAQLCVPFHRVMTTEGKCPLRGGIHYHRTCLRCDGRWVSAPPPGADALAPEECPACRGRDPRAVALLEATMGPDATVHAVPRLPPKPPPTPAPGPGRVVQEDYK
jgi:hypothetical protein